MNRKLLLVPAVITALGMCAAYGEYGNFIPSTNYTVTVWALCEPLTVTNPNTAPSFPGTAP